MNQGVICKSGLLLIFLRGMRKQMERPFMSFLGNTDIIE